MIPRVGKIIFDTVEPPTALERIEAEALEIKERSPKRVSERIKALRVADMKKRRPERPWGRQPLGLDYYERILRWFEMLRKECGYDEAVGNIARIEERKPGTIEMHVTEARKLLRKS